jgi:hypothetical protein
VCSLWTKLDEYEIIADLHRKAIERFGEDADRVRVEGWRNTLLEANVRLAKAAEAKGEGDEASRLWSEAGRLADDLLKSDRYSRIPQTVRLAAEVYGGYITMRGGVPTYNPCLGQFEKARGLWNKIERSLAAQNQPGGEPWWEAKFYDYFLHYKQEKAAGRNIQAFRARLQSLRTTNPEFGGPAWRPYFDWLLRQA